MSARPTCDIVSGLRIGIRSRPGLAVAQYMADAIERLDELEALTAREMQRVAHERQFPSEAAQAAAIVHAYTHGFPAPYEAWHHIDNAHNDLLREIVKQLVALVSAARADADRLAARLEGALGDVAHGMHGFSLRDIGGECQCGAHVALRAHRALVESPGATT